MIRLEHVSKSFRGRAALVDVSLDVRAGQTVGLLGPNGAGKSTLLGIALGLVRADTGDAFLDGVSIRRERSRALRQVGAVFEQAGFCNELSGERNLAMLADYSGGANPDQIREVVAFAGLSDRIADPVRTYSRGMRLRLAFAQALLPRPKVILLDEPMEGLDPVGVRDIRQLILNMRRDWGTTVVLCSHLLAEVEPLCDSIAILHQGRLLFSGSWKNQNEAGQRYRLSLSDQALASCALGSGGIMLGGDGILHLPPGRSLHQALELLLAAGVRIDEAEPLHRTLEEHYMEVISRR